MDKHFKIKKENVWKLFYSIFEMCYKKDCIEERYIDEFAKVCDILSIFQKETYDYKKQKIKRER